MNFKFSTNMFYDKINYIEGVLVTDSTLSKNNGSLFECLVENAQESENLNLKTSSVIKIYVSKNDKRAVAGQKCSFWDVKKLKDGFWSAKDIDILNYNLFQKIRKNFLIAAEKRILSLNKFFNSDDDYDAHLLALKLFCARQSGESDEIANLAKKTGLEFIFALSGMHLSILALIIGYILRLLTSKKQAKVLSALFVTAYFILVSRSQSFIRAFIMFTLSFLFPLPASLCISFVLQILILPQGCINLAFCYSYASLCGVVVLNNFFDYLLTGCFNKQVSKYFSPFFSCMTFSSLISLISFSNFAPVGAVISPVVSIFMGFLLACALVLVLFPANIVISLFTKISYLVIKYLLKYVSYVSFILSWGGYFAIMLIVGLIGYFMTKNNKNKTRMYREILDEVQK